jgi:acetyl-CoA synthetase
MVLADLAHDDREAVPGALSSVLPGHEVAILDADGAPQDGEGTLALHKPRYQTCTGYWKAEELWAKRWCGDYFLTGDIVRSDGEGRYWFVGRDDDLIVTSGYNVGPTEVENVLLGHDGVAEAAAVAAPDAERGSVVRAVIVLNGQVSAEQVAAELRAAVADKLGRHAAPRIVDFVDELPRTETGKIRRAALRQRADVS